MTPSSLLYRPVEGARARSCWSRSSCRGAPTERTVVLSISRIVRGLWGSGHAKCRPRDCSFRLHNRDFKIVDDGRPRRSNDCHATFHTFQMSPSELWDGGFSRGFSSWWRRLRVVRIYFNEISVFSSLFPMLSRIIFAHSWASVFLDVEINTTWKIAFLWHNARLEILFSVTLAKSLRLIILFSLLIMAAKETSVEK